MTNVLFRVIRRIIWRTGYLIRPLHWEDLTGIKAEDLEIIDSVKPYTMTPKLRIYSLMEAVRYVINNHVPGSFVECGIWKGGSIMTIAKTLNNLGISDREIYLFDTFEGMTKPTEVDIAHTGIPASELFEKARIDDNSSYLSRAELDEVKSNVFSTGYNKNKFHFVKGKVEDTLPTKAPSKIALLRLDTDLYESTHHELVHLFPLISSGGVLLIDDYGHMQGAKKAVDEYISSNNIPIFLVSIDFAARLGVKR